MPSQPELDKSDYVPNPEDGFEFARAEMNRLDQIASDPIAIHAELVKVRNRIAGIETQIQLAPSDEAVWIQCENISRCISQLDRICDAFKKHHLPQDGEHGS